MESRLSGQTDEDAKKNRGFTQVYKEGWGRIMSLVKQNVPAVKLYILLAENIDPGCGAVVSSQQFLADQLGVSTRTIRNWLRYLESVEALVQIPIAGRVCAYALNPHEVWKGYNTSKEYAAFTTKTLVNRDDAIQRRIVAMFERGKKAKHEGLEHSEAFI